MDSELSYLDPASYEPVFICNICNTVLTEPVCRNDHITDNSINYLEIDFENLITSTVVSNIGVQLYSMDDKPSDPELETQNKVCAVIPPPTRTQDPFDYLCPQCGKVSADEKCKKSHEFEVIKDICSTCGIECNSIETLMQHRINCIAMGEHLVKTTNLNSVSPLNVAEAVYDVAESTDLNLPTHFANMAQKGTLRQYQVMPSIVDEKNSVMDMMDTGLADFSMPLTDDMDGVFEWDETMSLAVLDFENGADEMPVFEDFSKPELEMMEASKPDKQSPPVIETKSNIQAAEEKRQLLLCKRCQMEFPDLDTFLPHHLSHGTSASFDCQFCLRHYTRLYWFRTHMETHADLLPIVCKFCDDYFLSTKLHVEHLQSVHQVDHDGEDKILKSLEYIQKNPYLCMRCGRWFKSKKHLEAHQKTHDMVKGRTVPVDEPIRADENTPTSSDHSPATVSSLKDDEKKKPIHIFECNICSANIRSIDEVRQHLLSHSENRPFKCEVCNERFSSTAQLQQHNCKQSKSTEINSYKCKDCDKVFSHAAGLAFHIRTHEQQLEAFSCDKCPEKFKVMSSYLLHRIKNH